MYTYKLYGCMYSKIQKKHVIYTFYHITMYPYHVRICTYNIESLQAAGGDRKIDKDTSPTFPLPLSLFFSFHFPLSIPTPLFFGLVKIISQLRTAAIF